MGKRDSEPLGPGEFRDLLAVMGELRDVGRDLCERLDRIEAAQPPSPGQAAAGALVGLLFPPK